MKKLCILIMILISCPVYADSFFEPDWSEFCPNKYIDINENGDYISSTAKYWAERKKLFKQRVAKCRNLDYEQQKWCYSELSTLESNATRTHNDEVRANAINRASIWGW